MRVSLSAVFITAAQAAQANPISKILDLLSGLRSKVVSDGEAEQKSYEEFSKWCKDESTEKKFEIEDGRNQVDSLTATIEKAAATISELDSKIAKLTKAVSQNEKDLDSATEVRHKEHEDYVSTDKEMVESIDTLEKAIAILEKALKQGSSLIQAVNTPAMQELSQSLSVIVDAGVIGTNDKARLSAFLQSHEEAEDSMGQAPEAAAYASHDGSSAIMDLLGDLLDKAESQKAAADKAEMTARFEYEKVKQSLTNQIAFDNKQLDASRKGLAAQREVKATAEGDLETTQKELNEDLKSDSETHDDCEKRAQEWDVSMQERAQEINALDTATKIIKEKTGGAENQAYGLVQVSSKAVTHDFRGALAQIASAGQKAGDKQLSALAVRVRAALSSSADPFAKVKGLISEMIEKLEKKAEEEASQHAFCETETKKSTDKKEDKESEIEGLSAKIDKAVSRIATLKEEIANMQGELASISKDNKEMTDLRSEEHASFLVVEKDYSDGIEGVQMALKVLRDYYSQGSFIQQPATSSHSKSSSAGGSIISIMEVAEEDFSRMLTEAREDEADAQSKYDSMMEENKLSTTTKSGGVKYKTQEIGQLEKAVAENKDSRDSVSEELDAVLEYLSKLNDQCIAKPEPYEERKRRREEEISGLKNALEILEGEAIGFLAVKTVKRHQ
jgi:chromosome segregation ATPase